MRSVMMLMSFSLSLFVAAVASAQQPVATTAPAAVATPDQAVPTPARAPQTPPRPAAPAPPATTRQGQPTSRPGVVPQPMAPPTGGAVPAAVQTPPAPRAELPSSWQNVKLEVSITDTFSATMQTKKAVTLLVLDGRSGQVRAQGGNGVLNVDAAPTIRPDGRIYLRLTVEYQPELTQEQMTQAGSGRTGYLNESLYIVISEGKPVTVSQSADPRNDRRVMMEVTATVIK